MCLDPITMTALTVASGVANYASQVQAAKAQEQAQRQAQANEIKRYQQQVSGIRAQQRQEETSSALEVLKADEEAHSGLATLQAASGESATTGISTSLREDDFQNLNLGYKVDQLVQERFRTQGIQYDLESAGGGFVSNMTRFMQPVPRPNLLGIALNTATAATQVYGAARMNQMREGLYADQAALRGAQIGRANRSLSSARRATALEQAQRGLVITSRVTQ